MSIFPQSFGEKKGKKRRKTKRNLWCRKNRKVYFILSAAIIKMASTMELKSFIIVLIGNKNHVFHAHMLFWSFLFFSYYILWFMFKLTKTNRTNYPNTIQFKIISENTKFPPALDRYTQLTFRFSESTIEKLEKSVKMFKFNSENTRATSLN